MSPSNRTRVHFAEDPAAVVVGTGTGPSDDDDEDEDSDQYYERMEWSNRWTLHCPATERMVREDEQPNVSGHMFIKLKNFLNNSLWCFEP